MYSCLRISFEKINLIPGSEFSFSPYNSATELQRGATLLINKLDEDYENYSRSALVVVKVGRDVIPGRVER